MHSFLETYSHGLLTSVKLGVGLFVELQPNPNPMIATGIISVFALLSFAISSIVTMVARMVLFPEKLELDNLLVLTVIFAVVAGGVFTYLYPIDFSGNRKDEEE